MNAEIQDQWEKVLQKEQDIINEKKRFLSLLKFDQRAQLLEIVGEIDEKYLDGLRSLYNEGFIYRTITINDFVKIGLELYNDEDEYLNRFILSIDGHENTVSSHNEYFSSEAFPALYRLAIETSEYKEWKELYALYKRINTICDTKNISMHDLFHENY